MKKKPKKIAPKPETKPVTNFSQFALMLIDPKRNQEKFDAFVDGMPGEGEDSEWTGMGLKLIAMFGLDETELADGKTRVLELAESDEELMLNENWYTDRLAVAMVKLDLVKDLYRKMVAVDATLDDATLKSSYEDVLDALERTKVKVPADIRKYVARLDKQAERSAAGPSEAHGLP